MKDIAKMDELKNRLIEIMNEYDIKNQTDLSKFLGVSKSLVNQWFSGYAGVGAKPLIAIEEKTKFSGKWVVTGELPKYKADISDIQKMNENQIRFELLNVQASLGNGIFHDSHVEVLDYLTVSREWAREHLGNNLSHIRVITAKGDSMKGTIESGDVLFVDESINYFNGEGIYVIAYADGIKAKRLQMQINGSLKIISDNAKYPPEIINANELDAIKICGKVKGAWNLSVF